MTRYEEHMGGGRGRRKVKVRGPWGDVMFGPPPPWGPHWGEPPRGPRRMRRGDIRVALLRTLQSGPAHGYEIIRRLEEGSGGLWRPSAGSVYPTLQMLEDEGLLTSHEEGGKRVYELTDAGRAEAESRAESGEGLPWEGDEDLTGHRDLRRALAQLMLASRQVQVAGEPELVERASAIVKEARQKLYQLLAES